MRVRSLLVGTFGLLAFAVLTSSASGATINITSGTSYTATARQTLTLDPTGLAIACDLSFGVGLTRTTISGAALPISATIGSVSRGSGGNCGGPTLTLLGLPWTLDGRNGTGTAAGTVLTMRDAQFQIAIGPAVCLYAGDVEGTVAASRAALSISHSMPLFLGSFLCPDPGELVGDLAISPAITITLTR